MRKYVLWAALILAVNLPAMALAQEEVALALKSGHVIRIPYGYSQIAEAMKRMREERNFVVEINVNGAPMLLNLPEVVAVCKGKCTYLDVVDKRDPSRAPAR